MYAMINGIFLESVTDVLLRSNSNVNAIDKEGRSVLDYAIIGNNLKKIKKLLKHGANLNLVNLTSTRLEVRKLIMDARMKV